MELFPSADDEQWAFIQREIDSSDYYILITAGKYGTLAPNGLSFTENEYDYAVSLKKYVMSFVRKDLTKVPAGQSEMDPDRRDKLESFHKKVTRSKLVRFYENPDELKALVSHGLRHAFQFQPREGWVRGKNLEDIARLLKRVAELEAENAKLSADPMALFAQGDDTFEWEIQLEARTPPKHGATDLPEPIPPPTDKFKLITSWNELLNTLFGSGGLDIPEYQVPGRFWQLITAKVAENYPGCEKWCALNQWGTHKGIESLCEAVKLQFQGLDFVEETTVERGNSFFGEYKVQCQTVWRLTRKGRAQLLAFKGIRRTILRE